MRTVIDAYRELPESLAIPDVVWDCYKARQRINELKEQFYQATLEFNKTCLKMRVELQKQWTDAEIEESGILYCT